MRISGTTIVFPPAADPSLPYGALPLLGAVLRRDGHDVTLRDVNLEAFDTLLRPDVLRRALDESGPPKRMSRQTVDEVIAAIDQARTVLRDPVDFYDPAKLLYAKRIFHLAGQVLTAGTPHLEFGKYSYSSSHYDSYEEVAAAVDADGGVLDTFFREVTVPSLLENAPDVIGMSVPYFSQLIPTFLLAQAIRDADPDVHITAGGPVMTWGKEVLTADPRFGRWLDSFFVGEADETLLHFVESRRGLREVESVPNLVRYVDGEVHSRLDPTYEVDLDWLPSPDYSSMPLDRYFAPKRIVCMVPTRGCYFNKCAFCNYAFIKMAPYRMRSAKLVAQDVAAVKSQTGEDVFCFESDVILPMHLRQISEALLAEDLDVKWHAVARFEKGFTDEVFSTMREAGCVRIYMGLESGNDRVLKAMVKGTDQKRMSEILAMCDRAGIAVEAGVFGDFPSETAEEALDTYRFIRDHRHVITRADVGTFRLLKGTPISENPDLFDITVRDDPAKRWYHLDHTDKVERRDTPGASAMERIQRLYPEVALIDVPEDILYTADVRAGVFNELFSRGRGAPAGSLPDSAKIALADGLQMQRILVANSGAVHFDEEVAPPAGGGLRDEGEGGRGGESAVFEVSRLSIAIALDRQCGSVHPLTELEECLVSALGDGVAEVGEARAEATRAATDDPEGDEEGGGAGHVVERLVARGILHVV